MARVPPAQGNSKPAHFCSLAVTCQLTEQRRTVLVFSIHRATTLHAAMRNLVQGLCTSTITRAAAPDFRSLPAFQPFASPQTIDLHVRPATANWPYCPFRKGTETESHRDQEQRKISPHSSFTGKK